MNCTFSVYDTDIALVVGDVSIFAGSAMAVHQTELLAAGVEIPEEYWDTRYFIGIAPGLYECLGTENLDAALAHEEGHIRLGHLELVGDSIEEYLAMEPAEIVRLETEADRYAADIHGVSAVCNALRQSATHMCSLTPEHTDAINTFIAYRVSTLENHF